MDERLLHNGIIKSGDIVYFAPTTRYNDLILHEDREVITITEFVIEPNSASQYGYYHAGIIRDSCMRHEDFAGWEHSEIDDEFRNMFLKEKYLKMFQGEAREVTRIIKIEKLGMKKMAMFIEKVTAFLTGRGIPVRGPEDYIRRKYRRS